MKTIKNILLGVLLVGIVVACNDGIDPISSVPPGPDEAAPVVVIKNPAVKKIIIPPTETATSVNFEFEVMDDIEIESIVVSLDGVQLATYSTFKDYRRATNSYLHQNLLVGNHTVEVTAKDLEGKSTVASFPFELSNVYTPKYAGEVFYMPFEAGYYMDFVSKSNATVIGTPAFADGKFGKSYAGKTDAYLSFPTTGLLSNQFTAAFWYKVNASPDRSGILTIGPPDPALPATPNNRKNGFRFFREGGATNQAFKLNVGTGASDSWFDSPDMVLNPSTAGWTHIAFTISNTECVVYFNGEVVKQGAFTGVDWTGCDILSIASGVPRFTEWGHLSDQSNIDELRFFNKALTAAEIKAVMDDK